jgi:hypothetical protein
MARSWATTFVGTPLPSVAVPSIAGCRSRKLISIVLRLDCQGTSNKSAIRFEQAMRAASATVRTKVGVLPLSDAQWNHWLRSGLVWAESVYLPGQSQLSGKSNGKV